ncbi:MAG: hypothetical protein IS860_08100 [Nitrosopumilus sp.]|nr:hypothetical protein [Nitrosopumilus sp.]MCE2507231.1 hypothetical protein [Nitrosopumilaceae archaeon]
MKTKYIISSVIGIAILPGIIFALNYDYSPPSPVFESQLTQVMDYCNDTSPVKNAILYYHSNETHSIDNIDCAWKLHQTYPDSEILCIPYVDKWVTGEEWRNQTHIFNKDSCMWEKDPDYDELNSKGCPQFCPKDARTYELETDSGNFTINYSIYGAVIQSIEKTSNGILDIQIGVFRDGELKITIPDSLIVDSSQDWGGSYVVLANGIELGYAAVIGESEQTLQIPLLSGTEIIQILTTYRISGTSEDDHVVGIVNWLAENHSTNGHVAIQVIDSDMNQNPDEVEKFEIHIWSDSDPNGITPSIYETDVDTGIFQSNIYFSEKPSNGQRLHTLEEDLVFASYEDHTLPSSSNNENLAILDSMII